MARPDLSGLALVGPSSADGFDDQSLGHDDDFGVLCLAELP